MLTYQASEVTVSRHSDVNKINLDYPLFVLCDNNSAKNIWQQLPYGDVLSKRWQSKLHKNNKNNLDTYTTTLPNDQGTALTLINLDETGKYNSTFKRLEILRKQIVELAKDKPKVLNLLLNTNQDLEEEFINNFIVCAGSYYTKLPKLTKNQDDLENNSCSNYNVAINYYTNNNKNYNHSQALAEIHGNGLTRFLCNLPANYLYPETYRNYIQVIADDNNWHYEFLDINTLTEKQAGAYLAVVQGSFRKDAGIVKLTYKPKNNPNNSPNNKKITLVGKGLCFDTGGYNLKTASGSMYGMNHDMTGSAVALGSLLALSKLEVPFEVEAWLALAQNDIGPQAYKPGDVVFASNGMSIEVINTDAEGRMVLCDTLHLASLSKPDLIIDYATLTGSCVRALDELYSGVITNQPHWNSAIIDIGQQCGERVWPFPFSDDYDEVLKSDVADIKQCHEGSADQIRAGRFLGKFINNDTPWIHIDLSSHAHKTGLGHIHSETTGFGVRFTLSCLLNSNLIN